MCRLLQETTSHPDIGSAGWPRNNANGFLSLKLRHKYLLSTNPTPPFPLSCIHF